MQDLIWSEIEKVNDNFARVETIKQFYLIEQQLTPEDEELTPTMKLKRTFVNKKYAARDRGDVSRTRRRRDRRGGSATIGSAVHVAGGMFGADLRAIKGRVVDEFEEESDMSLHSS